MRWPVFGLLCIGCVSTSVRCSNGFIVPATNVALPVAFLRLPVRGPLLCLTVTITVRERPIPLTPARAVLAAMFKEAGGHPDLPQSARAVSFDDVHDIDNSYHGLDEVVIAPVLLLPPPPTRCGRHDDNCGTDGSGGGDYRAICFRCQAATLVRIFPTLLP